MSYYPIKLDNPYIVRKTESHQRWGLYRKYPFQKICEFSSEFEAYSARRALVDYESIW